MILLYRAGIRRTRAVLCCLTVALAPAIAQADTLLAWRDAKSMPDLIEFLDVWLDANASVKRRAEAPSVLFVDKYAAAALSEAKSSAYTDTLRGLYDEDRQTIMLVHPWSARDPYDVSVLLHELVHHRQAEAGHWYCAGAQELPAYRRQQDWLAEMGLESEVNWIAVVLEAGCTSRDFHPS